MGRFSDDYAYEEYRKKVAPLIDREYNKMCKRETLFCHIEEELFVLSLCHRHSYAVLWAIVPKYHRFPASKILHHNTTEYFR